MNMYTLVRDLPCPYIAGVGIEMGDQKFSGLQCRRGLEGVGEYDEEKGVVL